MLLQGSDLKLALVAPARLSLFKPTLLLALSVMATVAHAYSSSCVVRHIQDDGKKKYLKDGVGSTHQWDMLIYYPLEGSTTTSTE